MSKVRMQIGVEIMRLIDADALLTRKMRSKYYHLPNGDIAIPIIDIELAQTVKPERKKGEWNNYKDEHSCSVCHSVVIQENWDDDIRYDFCPYCGAEMRGEDE